jgi:hypothetical protein
LDEHDRRVETLVVRGLGDDDRIATERLLRLRPTLVSWDGTWGGFSWDRSPYRLERDMVQVL